MEQHSGGTSSLALMLIQEGPNPRPHPYHPYLRPRLHYRLLTLCPAAY